MTSETPPSPSLSAHTTATNIGLPSNRLPSHLINRADLRSSLDAYDGLLTASKAYAQALMTMSSASSEVAIALETCSRLKGAHDAGAGLLAASGIQHMSSNSWSILADSFWKDISIPLLEHHDLYVQACADRTMQHEKAILEKSRSLHDAEKRNRKQAKGKVGRYLGSFRRALNELQKHVDELDEEKARYYSEVLEGEEECWSFVQDRTMCALQSQLDMHERIASKGMSDPVLEPLLARVADPFSAYGPPRSEDQIFSILGHNNLLGLTGSTNRQASQKEGDDASSTKYRLKDEEEHESFAPSKYIMSPSTPSKGLSRVTSGASSPKLESDARSKKGLGVSLTAAVDMARGAIDAEQATGEMSRKCDHANAELFGTEGEDEEADEASIFSGTEDEEAVSARNAADSEGHKAQGTAAKIMQEKKRRRDMAVRTSAKSRLKHALSTIDESKSNASPATTKTLAARDTNVDQPDMSDKRSEPPTDGLQTRDSPPPNQDEQGVWT